MFVAFVYHNVVPVVTTRLRSDRVQIRQAILLGSLIPLVMFLLWNAVILGSVEPLSNADADVGTAIDPIEMLRSGIDSAGLGVAVSVFSEFAIVTSFIGFIYGLVNFVSDVFGSVGELATKVEKSRHRMLITYSLVLFPPTVLSILSPTIFFDAIDISGAFGISILFGIIPAVMTWKQRYQSKEKTMQMVGGGKVTLAMMIAVAVAILLQHVLMKTGML